MEKTQRQFSKTSEKAKHYDRKVTHTQTTRVLSVGKLIPKDWAYVRMTVLKRGEGFVTVRFKRLELKSLNAQNKTTGKESESNS